MIKIALRLFRDCLLVIAVMMFIAWLVSCNPQRQAQKYYDKNPVELAKVCADKFPHQETITVKDSLHFDTLYIPQEYIVYDTVYIEGKPILIRRECPPAKIITKTVTREVVKTQIDARFHALQSDSIQKLHKKIEAANGAVIKAQGQTKEERDSKDKWRKRFYILLGVAAAVLGVAGLFKTLKIVKPKFL